MQGVMKSRLIFFFFFAMIGGMATYTAITKGLIDASIIFVIISLYSLIVFLLFPHKGFGDKATILAGAIALIVSIAIFLLLF